MKTYLVIYKGHSRRVEAKNSDDAIMKYFDNDHNQTLKVMMENNKENKACCKITIESIDELLSKIPDMRCYELANSSLLRASSKLYKDLNFKRNETYRELSRMASIETDKAKKEEKEKEEIAKLKMLARKYPHIIEQFSERYMP